MRKISGRGAERCTEMAEFYNTDSMVDVRSMSQYSYPHVVHCDQALVWSPFRPLRSAILCTPAQFIDSDVRTQLLYADECLYHQKYSEAISYLESGLCAIGCRRLPELRGLLWALLGTARAGTGDLQEACICYHNHLTCCIILGDIAGITKTECNLGITYAELGHLNLAKAWFSQYLDNSYRLQDQRSASVALNNLAVLSETLGVKAYHKKRKKHRDMSAARKILNQHLQTAVTYLEQHLMFEQQLNNIERQCHAYGKLGWCYQAMGQHTKAISYHNQCLEILKTTEDKIAESYTLCNLGNCLKVTGKLQEAIYHHTQNLELCRAIGYREGEIVSIFNLGTTCRLANQLDKAIEWHTLYYSAMIENRDLSQQAKALNTLAGLYEETHKMIKAEDCYRKLAGVYHQLKKKEAERMACLQAQKMRSEVKHEKQLSIKQSKRALKIYKSSPRRGKHRTVSCSTLHLIHEPMKIQRDDKKADTKHHQHSLNSLATQVDVQDCQRSVSHNKSEHVPRPFIQSQLNMTLQPSQQHEHGIIAQEQKQSCIIIPNQRSLPHIPQQSDDDSLTSFETVTLPEAEKNQSSSFLHHISRASLDMVERLMPGLLYTGGDYSQTTVSQQELSGQDKEWEQWLHIQDTTCSNPCSQALSETFEIASSALHRSRNNPRMSYTLSATFRPHTASDPNILDH